MFWGPSPLVLYCELRQHVSTSLEARRAAPEKWQLFRAALEDRFGITIDLYCVQMLPCIWRHLASTISAFDNSGVLCWKTASRNSVEKLWQMETCRLEEGKAWLQYLGLWDLFLQVTSKAKFLATVRWLPTTKKPKIEQMLRLADR